MTVLFPLSSVLEHTCFPAEWIGLLTKAARNHPTGAAACFPTPYSQQASDLRAGDLLSKHLQQYTLEASCKLFVATSVWKTSQALFVSVRTERFRRHSAFTITSKIYIK